MLHELKAVALQCELLFEAANVTQTDANSPDNPINSFLDAVQRGLDKVRKEKNYPKSRLLLVEAWPKRRKPSAAFLDFQHIGLHLTPDKHLTSDNIVKIYSDDWSYWEEPKIVGEETHATRSIDWDSIVMELWEAALLVKRAGHEEKYSQVSVGYKTWREGEADGQVYYMFRYGREKLVAVGTWDRGVRVITDGDAIEASGVDDGDDPVLVA